jgi:hypothetical protein
MGMESDKIKIIVAKAKALGQGDAEGAGSIMIAMVRDMSRSPTFAAAIIQHLKDGGVDLMNYQGEAAENFQAKFRPRMEKLDERELTQLRKISSKLFAG